MAGKTNIGSFRQTVMEQPEHIIYLPLRTKTFQTIDIYLTSGCGQPISFQGGTVNVVLHFRRRTRLNCMNCMNELYLPTGFQVMLPKNLARALGYLNHRDLVPALYRTSSPTSIELNKNQGVTLTATTTTIRRNDELVWGMLSKHSFQTMYVYSDLIESLVVGDV